MAKPKTSETSQVFDKTKSKTAETPPPPKTKSGEVPQASDKPRSKTGEIAFFDTRSGHKMLLEGFDSIAASLVDASVERRVELGSVLWDVGDRVAEVLDRIKDGLRSEALTRLQGQTGSCVLEGDDLGEANITIPEATLRVPRGKNVADIKQALGSDFSLFFEEVVTYKPRREFEERVAAVSDPLHRKILLSSIERVEQTPRVSFRRAKMKR